MTLAGLHDHERIPAPGQGGRMSQLPRTITESTEDPDTRSRTIRDHNEALDWIRGQVDATIRSDFCCPRKRNLGRCRRYARKAIQPERLRLTWEGWA